MLIVFSKPLGPPVNHVVISRVLLPSPPHLNMASQDQQVPQEVPNGVAPQSLLANARPSDSPGALRRWHSLNPSVPFET
jgi:hypothetical protein